MKRYPFNDNWYFTQKFDHGLINLKEPKTDFAQVRIPHTVQILPFNEFSEKAYQMVSGYLRFFTPPDCWKGKCIRAVFEGAAHYARVYLNGKLLAQHGCGYTAFTVDLTDYIYWDRLNNLTVELDSRETLDVPPFGNVIDFLTYGGLYREVFLEVGGSAFIDDLCVRADMDGSICCLPQCKNAQGMTLSISVWDTSGKELSRWEGNADVKEAFLSVEKPKLWSCENPALYFLKAVLHKNGTPVDEHTVRFGFRRVEFRTDGFYLNEKRIQLRGLDRHQIWPYIGYAAPSRAQRLDADILKYELGCNAVRTSHYPQSHHFIDRCDEIGLLVFTEIPGWQHIGGENWKNQVLINTQEMVLQWRNHPSIFLWGVRINESADDDRLYQSTNEIAHSLDPTRPTGGVRNFANSHLFEDVYTYNDFSHHGNNRGCAPRKTITKAKDKGYLISEYNGHMFPTKSYDWEGKRLEHALRHARVISDAVLEKGIAGSFGWCMFDYNTHRDFGSGDRICYHGVMDMFRNPKLAAAVYASQQEKTPVLEVSSSMDIGEHPAGVPGTVAVFTNADRVNVYRNDLHAGSFIQSKEYGGLSHPPILITDTVSGLLEKEEGFDHRTAVMVRDVLLGAAQFGSAMPLPLLLKAGYLMAFKGFTREKGVQLYNRYVASWGGQVVHWHFDAVKDNNVIASAVCCPGDKLLLEVKADTQQLTDGPSWDMATVRIRAVNEFTAVRTWCSRSVNFYAEGAVELIGPDSIPLSGGMAGCYLRTCGIGGEGRLTISMDGAEPVTLIFQVTKQEEEIL